LSFLDVVEQHAFPNASDEQCSAAVGRLTYYRYINPAIMQVQRVPHLLLTDSSYSTPETFDIVPSTVDVVSRKNLAQISRVLTQITSGCEFGDDNPSYLPINDYVRKSIAQMSAWMFEGEVYLVDVFLHTN
jgi:Ras GTPase-activating-like protein IQGAP2/3